MRKGYSTRLCASACLSVRPSLELTHGFFVRRFLPEIANMTAPRKPVWQTFKTRNSTRRNTSWSNVASTQFVIRQTMILHLRILPRVSQFCDFHFITPCNGTPFYTIPYGWPAISHYLLPGVVKDQARVIFSNVQLPLLIYLIH